MPKDLYQLTRDFWTLSRMIRRHGDKTEAMGRKVEHTANCSAGHPKLHSRLIQLNLDRQRSAA